MKIEIDTKEDSHETIRKAIDLLKSIVGEPSYSNKPGDIFSDDDSYGQSSSSEPKESSGGVFGNLFGSSQESTPSTEETITETPEEEKEEKEESIEIIPY